MFAASPRLDLANSKFAPFRKWKRSVLDKAFMVLHIGIHHELSFGYARGPRAFPCDPVGRAQAPLV